MAPSALLTPRAPNISTCSTPECLKTSQDILHDMDFNIDPCSDFYQYTCGGWLKDQVLPDDKNSNGTFEALTEIVNSDMRSILEGTYDNVYQNLTGSDEGFHTEDQVENDKHNFDTMQSFYNQCMNQSTLNSLGPTPIYSDIYLIENKLFPVNDSTALYSSAANVSMTQTVTLLQHNGVMGFATLFTYIDDKNPDMNAIMFDQPKTLSLPSKEYYTEPGIVELLRSGLNDLVYKVLGDYSNGTTDLELRQSESNRTGFHLWSQEKVQNAVNRFIDFESKLANATLPAAELQNRALLYNPIALSTFQTQNPMVDWTGILSALIPDEGIKLKPNTTIIIRAPAYFQGLNEILSTNVTLETLQEFFIISFLLAKVEFLDETSRVSLRSFAGKIGGGSTATKQRWQECVKTTSTYFPDVMGRYYVLKKFGGETEKEKIETFIDTIHQEWLHKLNFIDWLDNQTRSAAIEKVNLIAHKSAYGTTSPDLRSPTSIKEYSEGAAVNKTSFYGSATILNQVAADKLWKTANQKLDKGAWLMPAQTVNALYEANRNQIVVFAGILQSPFYTFNTPEYLNYGGIGMIIGHEITHAFDKNGRAYDGRGLLIDWWTNTTNTEFDNRSQCFVDQYSQFNVTIGDKNLPVNGKLTLSENIADNGGLTASYLAFQTLQANKTSERIQGLEQFSPEALFFINFGRVWCSKQRDELAQQYLLTDNHSPSVARVNGAIQNNDEFSTIFNCPVGSPMNPEKKCKMW